MNLWLNELSETLDQLDTRAKLLEALDIIDDQLTDLSDEEQAAAGELINALNRRLDAMQDGG